MGLQESSRPHSIGLLVICHFRRIPRIAIRLSLHSIKMHLHISWNALFTSITMVNEAGDRNVAGFTGAMDLEASLGEKMTKLVQRFGLLLAANEKKGIAILHHPHNFGGTLLCPSNKVGCLVGVGSSAVPVVLDHDVALCSITANVLPIPAIADCAIADCAIVDKFAALPTAPANVNGDFVAIAGGDADEDDDSAPANGVQAGNRHQRGQHSNNAAARQHGNDVDGTAAGNGAAGRARVAPTGRCGAPSNGNDDSVTIGEGNDDPADGGGTNLKALSCFIPTPFLSNAVLAADSSSPLELIIAARSVRDTHVLMHEGEEEFDEGNVDAHIELFSLWCLGVHQGKVGVTRFLLATHDGEIADWSTRLHRENILPGIARAGTLPASLEDTTAILRSLTAGISRTSEEAKNQNKLQCEQLDYIKVKDAKKKNKAEKWHANYQPTPCAQRSIGRWRLPYR